MKPAHIESPAPIEVLGATIDVRWDGRAHVLAWRDEITPQDPAARDLARAVGVDA